MPTPRKNESREDFVQRCIPIVLDEGTAEDGSQAAAICHSMYDNKNKKKTPDEEADENFKKHFSN